MYRSWLRVLTIVFGLVVLVGFNSGCNRHEEPEPQPVQFDPLDVETKPDLGETAPSATTKTAKANSIKANTAKVKAAKENAAKAAAAKQKPDFELTLKTKNKTPPDSQTAKQYVVQVGMFANKDNAAKLAKKLSDHGYKVESSDAENKKLGKVSVLRLKATSDLETARNNVQKLKVQEGITAVITSK